MMSQHAVRAMGTGRNTCQPVAEPSISAKGTGATAYL